MENNTYTYLFNHNKVRLKRELIGMSQETLALQSGISFGYISLIENGYRTPTANIVGSIARALNVDVNYFYDFVKKD